MSFLIGLISGIFGGLVGLGGGVVMIPLMTRLLGISQARPMAQASRSSFSPDFQGLAPTPWREPSISRQP